MASAECPQPNLDTIFSNDVIFRTLSVLPFNTLKALRLVNQHLHDLITPTVFSRRAALFLSQSNILDPDLAILTFIPQHCVLLPFKLEPDFPPTDILDSRVTTLLKSIPALTLCNQFRSPTFSANGEDNTPARWAKDPQVLPHYPDVLTTIGQMTNLKELHLLGGSEIFLHSATTKELEPLRNLEALHISGSAHSLRLPPVLTQLTNLRVLNCISHSSHATPEETLETDARIQLILANNRNTLESVAFLRSLPLPPDPSLFFPFPRLQVLSVHLPSSDMSRQVMLDFMNHVAPTLVKFNMNFGPVTVFSVLTHLSSQLLDLKLTWNQSLTPTAAVNRPFRSLRNLRFTRLQVLPGADPFGQVQEALPQEAAVSPFSNFMSWMPPTLRCLQATLSSKYVLQPSSVQHLGSLTTLDLSAWGVTDKFVQAVCDSARQMKILRFHSCPQLTDGAFVAISGGAGSPIAKLTELQELAIELCPRVTCNIVCGLRSQSLRKYVNVNAVRILATVKDESLNTDGCLLLLLTQNPNLKEVRCNLSPGFKQSLDTAYLYSAFPRLKTLESVPLY